MQNINPELISKIMASRALRQHVASLSHFWFFHMYFGHYVKYPTADFQREMFALTENKDIQNIVIVAFRGSAKSTIMNLSLPIWSILGSQQKKFILILGQTQEQARQHLKNIKEELESNELLRSDLGPFREENVDEWRSYSLVLPKYGAKLMAASTETAVRGLRHGQFRPDLIIGDDLEDQATTKTRESRDKTYQWLTGEVIPAGDHTTRLVIIGNLLHEDSLIMRLKKSMELGNLDGVFRAYPLIDNQDKVLWPGKYPNLASINFERKRSGNDSAWQREYLLRIISDSERVVHPEWLHYYEDYELPSTTPSNLEDEDRDTAFRYAAFAVDLAISQKETADYTAMVAGIVCGYGENFRIYILPFPVNERLDFPKTIEKVKMVFQTLIPGHRPKVFIEEVAYQSAIIQQLQQDHYPVEGVRPGGQDKRARIALITQFIKNGVVIFPKSGAETLIGQLIGFGIERHDDLADAFTMLITKITEGHNHRPESLYAMNPQLHHPNPDSIMNMKF